MVEFLQMFFDMGGYGFYVWGSYGLVAAVLAYQFCAPLRRHKKLRAELGKMANAANATRATKVQK